MSEAEGAAPATAPLLNKRFFLAFLLGPLAGALLYSAVLGIASVSIESFLFYATASTVYGYTVGVAIFLPLFLIMRWASVENVLIYPAIGFATGLLFHKVLFDAAVFGSEFMSFVLYGALPFAVIATVIRLIAGRRG